MIGVRTKNKGYMESNRSKQKKIREIREMGEVIGARTKNKGR